MKLENYHYFYLFVSFLFLGIVSVELFSDGMFMDGLLYADISRNMAEGLGCFWRPHLSYGLLNEFYEHPPLALGLESLFFKLFGDSIFVERFYSLLTFIIIGYLIVLIWAKLTKDRQNGWMPLLVWITTGDMLWASANNMLENTMSIFVCLSLLLYMNSREKRRFMWIVFSGFSLFLGLLSKGFVCLYIWSLPFFIWILKREKNFLQMLIDTITLVLATIIPVALLYFFIPNAKHNMLNYFNKQVLGSIQNVVTVDSRFEIVGVFLENITAPIIFGIIIVLVAIRNKVPKFKLKENLKEALIFLFVVLSGVIPIMISMKQRSFYILTVYPLFAIGLSYYLYPFIKLGIDNLNINNYKGLRIFKGITIGIVIISISLSLFQTTRVGRDNDMIYDTKAIINEIGENQTINICSSLYSIWALHGYFSRYGNVSLERNKKNVCKYYLSLKNCDVGYLNKNYELVPLELKTYNLYKSKIVN